MALTPVRGTQVYVKIGDGSSPEVFAHPCLINARRGVQFRSSSNKTVIPNCDLPDDPAWEQVFTDALGVTISGAGKVDNILATIQLYDLWWRGGLVKNIQVWLGTVGRWSLAAKLTSWEITGDRGDNADVSVTIESHGTVGAFAAS